MSVTSGVVSRIEVTAYAHGSAELLGIQVCPCSCLQSLRKTVLTFLASRQHACIVWHSCLLQHTCG